MTIDQLFDMFNIYHAKALADKKKNNMPSCKRNLEHSAKLMLEIAKLSQGDSKRIRLEKAKQLIALANQLGSDLSEESAAGSTTKRPSPRSSEVSNNEDDGLNEFNETAIPNITFNDVAGLEDVKKAVYERIILPLKYADYYKKGNVKMGGGILMYGLPGTGKTMVAKAIANESQAHFYQIKCSDIVSKWFGEAEKNIKKLFETARKHERAIIFFDEFEALATKRGGSSTVMNRIVPELLAQIQGFEDDDCLLLLIAATNRPWDIDSAMVRPGRFSQLIHVPLPDLKARRRIAELNLDESQLSGVTFDDIARDTDGFNCSDIAELCNRLSTNAVTKTIARDRALGKQPSEINIELITADDYKSIISTISTSALESDKQMLLKFEQDRNNVD